MHSYILTFQESLIPFDINELEGQFSQKCTDRKAYNIQSHQGCDVIIVAQNGQNPNGFQPYLCVLFCFFFFLHKTTVTKNGKSEKMQKKTCI